MSEMESQLEECGVCHSLRKYEELACFDDTLICSDCLEDSTVICGRCGERIWIEDDDRVLCYDCHRRHRSRYSINDYSYKPDPIFYGSDTLFMGVEIELDEGGESDNQARKLDYRSHQAKTCGLHMHVNRTAFGDTDLVDVYYDSSNGKHVDILGKLTPCLTKDQKQLEIVWKHLSEETHPDDYRDKRSFRQRDECLVALTTEIAGRAAP